MSEEFAPEIQVNFGETILTFILSALKHQYLKVQFKAVQAIQNFQKGIVNHKDVRVMEPFIEPMLTELSKIFEASVMNLQYLMLEAVLDSISIIAENNDFAKYYPFFIPGLKKIIASIGNDTQQKIMIRAKSVETIGFLLASIKDHKELFEPDCK